MEDFNIGVPGAALGLSMYVLGYGIGPMLFSPLSEIPSIGRNLPYITTLTLFLILSVPTTVTPPYAGLLVTRFLTGFFGSPCLATDGATIQDLYSFTKLPYGLSAWVASQFCAPALGPLLSVFSTSALGRRWSLYEVLLMASPALIMKWVAFPETSGANILLRRAKCLQQLTGDSSYKSQSELDHKNMTPRQIAIDALVMPMQIMLQDPAVFFTNIYSAFICGVYYSFFEAFPLVYMYIYGFSVGIMSLGKRTIPGSNASVQTDVVHQVFLVIVVGCITCMFIYFTYVHFYLVCTQTTSARTQARSSNLRFHRIANWAIHLRLHITERHSVDCFGRWYWHVCCVRLRTLPVHIYVLAAFLSSLRSQHIRGQ